MQITARRAVPERQGLLWHLPLADQEIPVDPGKRRRGRCNRLYPVHEPCIRQWRTWANSIEGARSRLFEEMDIELSQVAHIDKLYRVDRVTLHQNISSIVNTINPIREPVRSIAWSNDDRRAGN